MEVKLEHTLLGILVTISVALLINAPVGFFIGIGIGCVLELIRYKLESK